MITAELLAEIPLLAEVPYDERASLAAQAADVRVGVGEWLVREGESAAFFAILEGRAEVLKAFAGHDEQLGEYRRGDYFGEVPLLLNSSALASVRALEVMRVARLSGKDFLELVSACATLNARIMKTMAQRVGSIQRATAGQHAAVATVVGRRLDLACHDVRDFLSRNRIPFAWSDPDVNPAAAAKVQEREDDTLPLIVLPNGDHLRNPTFRALADAVGLKTVPSLPMYDVAVIGGGPAGLAAAVYGASEGLRTLLIERVAPGGQAGTSSRIENYLGFPAGITGDDLAARAQQQAARFNAELLVARSVTDIDLDGRAIVLDGNERVSVASVVLAMGVSWQRLRVPGIERFIGRGVYYGAARTEALGLRGKRVHLIGGGNSAGQAAMLFASYADEVTLLVRGPALAASMSQYLVEQLATKANISIRTNTSVAGVRGEDHIESLVLATGGVEEVVPTDAMFVFIGARAETAWLPKQILRDSRGYVCTGRDMLALAGAKDADPNGPRWPIERDPFLLETSVPGIFAAGDVRHDSVKRVASGVGEGSMSIAFVHQYLAELRSSLAASG